MNAFYRKAIAITVLLMSCTAIADTPWDEVGRHFISQQDLIEQQRLVISGIEVIELRGGICRKDGCCPDGSTPNFVNEDPDDDGIFEEVCIGLRYDPCNTVESVAAAMNEYQQAGFVCVDEPECSPTSPEPAISPSLPPCPAPLLPAPK